MYVGVLIVPIFRDDTTITIGEIYMGLNKLAGKPAPNDMLVNIPRLVASYYTQRPDVRDPLQKVSFGTSGHRGTSLKNTFNEAHILAITQAICEIRKMNDVSGPLFLGKDTHALSEPAFISALEVFAANQVEVRIDKDMGFTPTPVISHAILTFNKANSKISSDGIVITPSHNPPEDGGLKYNPPTGGPADTALTRQIEDRANEILKSNLTEVNRIPITQALKASTVKYYDYIQPYIQDLSSVINMDLIKSIKLKIGVDPMGGSGIAYWEPLAELYHLNIDIVNQKIDPTFSFMTLDKDGKIRMDCSSPYAMAGLINLKERYDIAFGNDPDYDRHGIVTREAGLLNPNHFLAVSIWYLFQNRPQWKEDVAIGKTLVSSAMIDRVAGHLNKRLYEVPVGFKWFVDGLMKGFLGFGGEESAGAAFLKMDGSSWTTDKDGIIMDLLAVEIMAKTGHDPGWHYHQLEKKFGSPVYERSDAIASKAEKTVLKSLNQNHITADFLAGDKILDKLTEAPGNKASIDGVKVVTENGWFAARPSGTEDIYKIYAESFIGTDHLIKIQQEAREIVQKALKAAGI